MLDTDSATSSCAGPRRPGAHHLLIAATDRERRVGAAAWVDEQVARGAKVYYKGWLGDGQPWVLGADGARSAPDALASGQLELRDYSWVIQQAGGTTEGLRQLQTAEVTSAVDEGWPLVAMSQESAGRPMASAAEATEFAAQESTYDDLALRWPLTTLCQLTLAEENKAAVWESAAVHHHDIVDPQWTCSMVGGQWQVSGALDAHVSEQFGAALYGALREARTSGPDADLHVNLAGVGFLDLAVVQTFVLTACSVARHQQIVLHETSAFVRRVLDTVGLPRNVRPSGEPTR